MRTFNFDIWEHNFKVSIYSSSWEEAETILLSYIEENELNWNYSYSYD